MIPPPKVTPRRSKIQRISLRDWEKGLVTALDDRRTPTKGLRHAENIILEQDGTPRPRPGLRPYGPPLLGRRLGQLYEFRVTGTNGSVNWLATMQVVGGVASVYVARGEDSAWTLVSGKNYNTAASAHFLQVGGKILVMNGEDNLSFVNTTNMTAVGFAAIPNPAAAPTLKTNTGLTGGTAFKVYYAVTANSSVGETAGSPVLQQVVLTDRDLWNPDTQSITIQWDAVTGAVSYNVYIGIGVDGGGQPTLYQVATGIPSSTLEFKDNGTRARDLSCPLPEDNSTAGPKVTRGCVVNGRAWLVGDKDNPFYIRRGGDYKHEIDFSAGNGGGHSVVGSGTKEIPMSVQPYRDGKGDPAVTVLSQGTNGAGKRFLIRPEQVTYGADSFMIWDVSEDTGADGGTDSPDGVIIYNNDLHHPSRDGFKTTGTIPQLQNVFSTRRTSASLQTDISLLKTSAMGGCVGLAYEGRLYWAVPVNSDTNNQIWVLDLDRKGAWMKWQISAEWMTLYNDNSGKTHFLIAKEDGIYELARTNYTLDGGDGFNTTAISGQLRFSEDGRDWARVLKVIYVIMRPQGRINFSVSGRSEEEVVTFNESRFFGAAGSRTGWGEPQCGWGRRGWGEIKRTPTAYNTASEEIELEVDEDLQWLRYSWSSVGGGVDYTLSDVIVEFVNIGTKDLS